RGEKATWRGRLRGTLPEPHAPPGHRLGAHVSPLPLDQIVGHENDRHFLQEFLADGLSADPPLQLAERKDLAAPPRQDFSVDDHAVRDRLAEVLEFWITLGHEFFTSRPDERPPAAADELRADPVPFPFGLPFGDVAERLGRALERVRQEERVRPAGVDVGDLGGGQRDEERGRRLPVAHEPVRDRLGRDTAGLTQGPRHEKLRHAHAEGPGDELVPDERLSLVHRRPGGEHRGLLPLLAVAPEGKQDLLDPFAERPVGGPDRRGEDESNRLGQVADGVAALGEQPVRNTGDFRGPIAKLARRHGLAWLAAGQEIDGPRSVGGADTGEVSGQRLDLFRGFGRGVEGRIKLGEGFHASPSGSSASPSNAVLSPMASSPSSRKRRTIVSTNPCVTRTCSAPDSLTTVCSPGQSTWSDRTNPRSTARRRRAPRTRIHPDAIAVDAGTNRRVQAELCASGGARIIAPAHFVPAGAALTGCVGGSATPAARYS